MRTFTPLMLTMLVGLGLMGSSNGLDTTKEEEETPRDPNFKPPKRMELIGKWLAEHPDKFPTLFELPFMGTHQSPTSRNGLTSEAPTVVEGPVKPSGPNAPKVVAKAAAPCVGLELSTSQHQTIYEQLRNGVRAFDFRPQCSVATGKIHHYNGKCEFGEIKAHLKEINSFLLLETSKSEIVVLQFEDLVDFDAKCTTTFKNDLHNSLLGQNIITRSDTSKGWPSVRQLIQQNKRVMIVTDDIKMFKADTAHSLLKNNEAKATDKDATGFTFNTNVVATLKAGVAKQIMNTITRRADSTTLRAGRGPPMSHLHFYLSPPNAKADVETNSPFALVEKSGKEIHNFKEYLNTTFSNITTLNIVWLDYVFLEEKSLLLPYIDAHVEYSWGKLRSIVYDYAGCFQDDAKSLVMNGAIKESTNMTDTVCSAFCADKGFRYFGLQYKRFCYCGGDDYDRLGKLDTKMCNSPCSGDPKVMCGGITTNSVYNIRLFDKPYEYIGCFKDTDTTIKVMSGAFGQNKLMTPDMCSEFCTKHGFRFFGVQYKRHCYCGGGEDYARLGKLNSGMCNSPCLGAPNWMCGGIDTSSVYQIEVWDKPYEYIGCFKDDKTSHVMNGGYMKEGLVTPAACNKYCSSHGFKYFGLQYKRHCYCGGDDYARLGQLDSGKCRSPCNGDVQVMCGGSDTNSVYRSTDVTVQSYEYVGCHKDDKTNVMNQASFTGSTVTPEVCKNFCTRYAFRYFGLQYKRTCFCGGAEYDRLGKIDAGECSSPCLGLPGVMCGGDGKNSVYQIDYQAKAYSYEYLGCYNDNKDSNHLLDGANFEGDLVTGVTPESCAKFCMKNGKNYFGLQYKRQCYCGDNTYNSLGQIKSLDCDTPCEAEPGVSCGGVYKNSVYKITVQASPYEYVGCYQDDKTSPVLNGAFIEDELTSPETCRKFCTDLGFRYFGLQYKRNCHCGGAEYGRLGKVNAVKCNTPCLGAPEVMCGGDLTNSVYHML